LFFQPEQYFSLTTNQSTMFFSRLISTAERALESDTIIDGDRDRTILPDYCREKPYFFQIIVKLKSSAPLRVQHFFMVSDFGHVFNSFY
jgi:hypothetical protein